MYQRQSWLIFFWYHFSAYRAIICNINKWIWYYAPLSFGRFAAECEVCVRACVCVCVNWSRACIEQISRLTTSDHSHHTPHNTNYVQNSKITFYGLLNLAKIIQTCHWGIWCFEDISQQHKHSFKLNTREKKETFQQFVSNKSGTLTAIWTWGQPQSPTKQTITCVGLFSKSRKAKSCKKNSVFVNESNTKHTPHD